jgi:hypothetical protein
MAKVSSVVITPETRRPLAEALLALPWPQQTDGQSIVMKVPLLKKDIISGSVETIGEDILSHSGLAELSQ